MNQIKKMFFGLAILFMAMMGGVFYYNSVSAITVSPMKQVITLVPGEEYTGKIKIHAERSSNRDEQFYEASIVPLSINDSDNNYVGVFDKINDTNKIVEWTTLSDKESTAGYGESLTGSIARDDSKELYYTIQVPKNANGGGQYFAIMSKQVKDPNQKVEGNVLIEESLGIASVVYVEISGDLTVSGEIKDNNIPGFLLNPPVTASFVAKNDGNTHAEITYYMQVFPLFSGEEIYTTEENPGTDYVLPGTTRYIEQTWNDTPAVGIFKVRQTVYYDSTDNEPSVTEKMVIVCPVWLLFLIIFVIITLVIWIVMKIRSKGNKKARRASESKAE